MIAMKRRESKREYYTEKYFEVIDVRGKLDAWMPRPFSAWDASAKFSKIL
jgi:hypothetical protein